MQRFNNWRWWTVALRGVAAIILGFVSVIDPGVTFLSLVILFGIFAMVDGVLALGLASRTSSQLRTAVIARGLISVAAGLLALLMPGVTGWALFVVIAAWAVVAGILEIVTAIRARKEIHGEGLLILEGVLSIAFGVFLILSPLAGVIVLGLWVGVYALVLGGMMLASAFRLRHIQHGEPAMLAS